PGRRARCPAGLLPGRRRRTGLPGDAGRGCARRAGARGPAMKPGPIRRAAGTIGLLALVPTAVMLIKGHIVLEVAAVRAGVTLGAVRRARALAGTRGSVFVVAALQPGAAAAGRCEQLPGVEIVPAIGSEALRTAWEATPPGPVLFLHDDVLLTAPNLDRMLAE